jgi:isocitrate dehydrogenase kinase/phosphatase
MLMKKYLIVGLAFIAFTPPIVFADSPITSTAFYTVYLDVDMVKKAEAEGVMNLDFAEFLCDPDVPLDHKAALVNALSWNIDGKQNAEIFTYYLALKNKKTVTDLKMEDLSAPELMCLGYLTVLDDYFNPDKALPYLEKAAEKLPKSYTAAIINALARAQKLMDSDWREVWKVTEKVFEDKKLKMDMKQKARDIIYDYMVLYRK